MGHEDFYLNNKLVSDNRTDAEKFYTNFKAKYKENEYLIFN